jgi:hypothetical protein
MKRLLWGLILVGIGLLSAMSATRNDVDRLGATILIQDGTGATVLLVGGEVMLYFGWQSLERG